jgi:NADH dehydrogenase FAD-containing subunit
MKKIGAYRRRPCPHGHAGQPGQIIEKGHTVTVIGPSEYHYYSGMGPGMLSGTYRPEEIRFATRHVVEKQGGTFLHGQSGHDRSRQKNVILENGQTVPYDVLSCNAGSHVPKPAIEGELDRYLYRQTHRTVDGSQKPPHRPFRAGTSPHVVIVGGGPSAAEVAGNVWQLATTTGGHMPRITVCAGSALCPAFPHRSAARSVRRLSRRGISDPRRAYAKSISLGSVTLDNGETLPADFIFLALGVKPSAIFADSGIATGPDGGLRVNRFLQSTHHPDIFGGGDCIYFEDQPLDKVGVYAVRQNPVLSTTSRPGWTAAT